MAETGGTGIVLGAIAGALALGIGIALFRKKPATETTAPAAELPEFTPSAAPVPASAPAQTATPTSTPTSKPPQDVVSFTPEPSAPIYVDFTYQPPPQSKPVQRTGE